MRGLRVQREVAFWINMSEYSSGVYMVTLTKYKNAGDVWGAIWI